VRHFDDTTAKVVVLVIGGAAALLAVGTAWSRGIIRVIPPVWHGIADRGATFLLIIAPWVFGYSDHPLASVFCWAVGGGGLVATLLTRFDSDLEPATGAAHMHHAV
jgi:hypothetical protein